MLKYKQKFKHSNRDENRPKTVPKGNNILYFSQHGVVLINIKNNLIILISLFKMCFII